MTTSPIPATPPFRPALASGIELSGEMPGNAFAQSQWLIQRGGRFLQVSEVLYRVAELCDGTHSFDEIAVLVAARTRRDVSADDVRTLVEQKLVPAGVVAHPRQPAAPQPPGAPTARQPASPLAVQLRATLIGPRVIAPLAWLGSALYVPGIVLAVLATTVGARLWLYGQHGVGDAVTRVVYDPSLFLVIGGLAIGSAAFHELGHAAALRVAGGRARGMGVGLYFIYPVFFTDVTDSYRLGRWRRVLTDLGGFYFNLVFSLALLTAYAITHEEALLLGVALTDLEILHQLLPLGRLDGYWLLSDVVGVPDMFSMAAPMGQRALQQNTSAPALRPVATVAVALYLALIIPAFALLAYVMGRGTPRVAHASLDSFLRQAEHFDVARAAGDLGAAAAAVGQGVLLTLPLLAIAFFFASILRWIARAFLRASGRTRAQRVAGMASALAGATLLFALWSPFSLGFAGIVPPHIRAIEQSLPTTLPSFLPELTSDGPPTLPLTTRRPLPSGAAPAASAPVQRTAAPVPRTAAPAAPTAVPAATAPPAEVPPSPTGSPSAAPTASPSPSASTSPTSVP